MGTRRPLLVQMQYDESATAPVCCMQDEDGEGYGEPITPETRVAEAIRERTVEHLKQLGGASVSSKPIVLRVKYVRGACELAPSASCSIAVPAEKVLCLEQFRDMRSC